MTSCSKFKPVQNGVAVFHTQPAGSCTDCVYFSQKNCGWRSPEAEDSLQDALFLL